MSTPFHTQTLPTDSSSFHSLKQQANAAFLNNNFKQARFLYTHIITLLEKELYFNVKVEETSTPNDSLQNTNIYAKLSIIFNNRAKAYMNLGQYDLALVDAECSLGYLRDEQAESSPFVSPSSMHHAERLLLQSKSLFSIAKSFYLLKLHEDAKKNIVEALKILSELEQIRDQDGDTSQDGSDVRSTTDHLSLKQNITLCRKLLASIEKHENEQQKTPNIDIHLDYKFIPYERTHTYDFRKLHIKMMQLNPDLAINVRDATNAQLDREVYAVRVIKEGEIFFREYASFVVNAEQRVCEQCAKLLPIQNSTMKCKQCQMEFCSEVCDEIAQVWHAHFPEEDPSSWTQLRRLCRKENDYIPLFIAKIIGEKKKFLSLLTPEQLQKIRDLRDQQLDATHMLIQVHPNLVTGTKFQQLRQVYFNIRRVLGLDRRPSFDFEWFLAQYYTVACNLFRSKSTLEEKQASNMLLFTGFSSFFNHSPQETSNASFMTVGNCILFQATRDIEQGEAICIAYDDKCYDMSSLSL